MKMGVVTVKFIGKEYSIPTDVLRYMELLSFTNNVKERLLNIFIRKIKSNIDIIEKKDFLEKEILDEANKFIAKLCENDIYDRTANDYIKNNKGYEFIHTVNAEALKNIIAIRSARNEVYKTGVQNAIYKKEASVTGLDFGIISNSLVNHAIYATMNASEEHKQEQAALKQYNKEIEDLRENVLSNYEAQEQKYISSVYVEGIELGFTALTVEWLDKLLSDLVKNNKFDSNTLKYIDLERSNDLLKNLNLAKNKTPILETAFLACPFNIAIYMNAMKYDLLDYETFQTAKYFKQSDTIISFLKEALGEANYPNFVEPNYYSATLLARYTNKSVNDILHQHTASYANAVIREYGKIVQALDNPNLCRDHLRKLNDDEILSGEGTSKRLANSLVHSIVSNGTWNILMEQCSHADLFERLQATAPTGVTICTKAEYDSYLAKALFDALEQVRKDSAKKIMDSRDRAEAERQKLETQKQKKCIKTTAIWCAIIAVIIIAVSLPSIIESVKESNREAVIENRIQEVVTALEQKIESQVDDDIVISYSYEKFNESNRFLKWSFKIKMTKFEEFRSSGDQDEALLREIMDNCRIIDDIVEDEYDNFKFGVEVGDEYIDVSNFDGTVSYGDLSSNERFYYEEYGGERYLHSTDTEYVLEK